MADRATRPLMNIARLKNFTEVVRNGFNISATAERLYTSQPTLSKQMKMLEDELGLALFTRRGKNLVGLTPAGERVMELAKGVVAQVEQISQLSLGEQLATSGVLRIATTHTQARYTLPSVITAFHHRYPEVAIHIHQGAPAQLAQMVQSGDVEMAIATESMYLFDELAAIPCHRWGRSVVVPHGHPLLECQPLSMADLARYPLITYVFGFTGRSKMDKAFGRHGLSPKTVLTATDTDVIKHYVRLGMGVGVIASVAFDEGDRESLVCLNIDHLIASSATHVCLRRHQHLRDYIYDFIHLYAPHISRETVQQHLVNQAPVADMVELPWL
ncbi:LysR family transcriptional regulator [Aeromonas schubertii]|uniref:LysR family transcriptional regulator n=2 Tax=Aeromonas schubertii TaxID=652 RepID=A0ABS7V9Q3_9GAMM|nr:LysR substrate-binding domain-containing protein [Aeromonas schubertii]MBZ6066115.1 LysR family transcriptional regulator [Aeromonas schubertii]